MPEWYANPDPRYQPAMRLITVITKADPVVVTCSFAHDYVSGLILRINVPSYYGMVQIDKHVGEITVLSPTTFSMALNSTGFDTFVVPASPPYYNKTATCVPVGNILDVYNVAVRNVSE